MSWARRAAVLVVLGGGMLAACDAGRSTNTSSTEPSPAVPEVFFAERQPGGDDMLSAVRGKLVIDDRGCLRVRHATGSPAVVWPAGFEPEVGSAGMRVLDGEGRVAARVDEAVHMGGGESPISGNGAVDGRTERRLRERCPGTYWIAAPSINIPGRG
jgi:hypothetical protein